MIAIDWDPKLKKFVVQCPFHANDLIRDLPSKSWSKARRAWLVQPIRQNMEFITKRLNMVAQWTPSASNAKLDLEAQVKDKAVATGFPAHFPHKMPPRAHQVRGLNKLYGLTAMALHADRGTGKTKMTADIAAALNMEGKVKILLVVCKRSLRRNWQDQFEEHCAVPYSLHIPETGNIRQFEHWLKTPHDLKVLVVGTESLSAGRMVKIAERFLMSDTAAMMCVDETHMIANHKATRSNNCVELGKLARYRIGLTGTPISVGPMDLFMQYEFLDTDVIGLGDFYAFRNRYAIMGGYTDPRGKPMEIIGYQNMDELVKAVSPYTFSVKKSDVLDLPPKVYTRRYVELSDRQRKIYNTIRVDETYTVKGETHVLKNTLEKALRLHQVVGGHLVKPREVSHRRKDGEMTVKKVYDPEWVVSWNENPKVMEVSGMFEECDNGPTIIWCAYRPEIHDLQLMFAKDHPTLVVEVLIGGSGDEDWVNIQKFQNGEIDVLLSTTSIGGTGFTMTRAETMIYFSNTEKLVDRLQSEDRAHRDGLTHSVLYVDIIAEKTVDVSIIKSIERKQNLSDYVRDRIGEADAVMQGE